MATESDNVLWAKIRAGHEKLVATPTLSLWLCIHLATHQATHNYITSHVALCYHELTWNYKFLYYENIFSPLYENFMQRNFGATQYTVCSNCVVLNFCGDQFLWISWVLLSTKIYWILAILYVCHKYLNIQNNQPYGMLFIWWWF